MPIPLIMIILMSLASLRADVTIEVVGIESSEIITEIHDYIIKDKAIIEQASADELSVMVDFYTSKVTQLIEYFGYYQSEVDSYFVTNDEPGSHVLRVDISLGNRVTVKDVSVHLIGSTEIDEQIFISELKTKPGDEFSLQQYERDKSSLMQLLDNYGYIRSDVEQSMVYVDTQDNLASVKYVLRLGMRYRFGDLNIKARHLNSKFIEAYAPGSMTKGAYYSSRLIESWYSELVKLPYFDLVTIEPDFNNIHSDSNLIDVYVNTKPADFVRHVTGVGYDSIDWFYLNHKAQFHPINRYGHMVSVSLRYNQKRRLSTEITYTVPSLTNPMNEAMDIRYVHIPTATFASGEYRHDDFQFSQHSSSKDAIFNAALGFLSEHYTMPNSSYEQHDYMPYVYASIVFTDWWVDRLNMINSLITIENEMSLRQAKNYYRSLWNASFRFDLSFLILELRHQWGQVWKNNGRSLPLSRYFALGSSNGLRGYNGHSIGPGEVMQSVQIEAQKAIGEEGIYTYGFFDTGYAADTLKWSGYQKSIGLGLMYRSNLDFDVKGSVAHPIHGRGIRVGISIEKMF